MRAAFAAPGAAELARLLNVRSAMAVPLQFRGKRTGAMSFLSDHRTYGQDDLRFAEAYARQVSGILENTRLYQHAEEAIRVRDEFVSLASHELERRSPRCARRPRGSSGRRTRATARPRSPSSGWKNRRPAGRAAPSPERAASRRVADRGAPDAAD